MKIRLVVTVLQGMTRIGAHCADWVNVLWERVSGRKSSPFVAYILANGGGQDGRYGLRAVRQKPNSVKEDDLNFYVTRFISSLCAIAAEHGVTSSVQLLADPAVIKVKSEVRLVQYPRR